MGKNSSGGNPFSEKVLASTMPALHSEDEKEEVGIASESSSPSRHFRSLPLLGLRRPSKIGSDGAVEDDHHAVIINGVRSTSTSQHTSPLASRAVSPVSTPASSVAHGYFDGGSPPQRTPERKRMSWLGSMPVSALTPHRVAAGSEESSPTSACPRSGKKEPLSTSSSSSSSACPIQATSGHNNDPSVDAVAPEKINSRALSLVPNAQFLGLVLLLILIISSPLIKLLSVLLFVAVVLLDDA
ncbi:hypothetical protein EX895_004049 [Sporisorium graminicola]|uniref:Uncharacterized protein n=1 Tax=Sporisorium graminicola TaxID=280036 RepID=A0A4U7KWS4_9BASI|nr:hypothetical protein EX895_004049 [Sporisorium graminicola]TKY87372.1 hypothetical protein EX895_004049 [Sporisorium graminicola]